jgi:hypothetical protein
MIGLLSWALGVAGPAWAAEASPRTDTWQVSLYGFGLAPATSDLQVDGVAVTDARISRAYGAGLKGDWFPAVSGGIVGLEAEVFGHGGTVSAPAGTTSANGDLKNLNVLVNVLARYPGQTLQPYVGVGVGVSWSRFSDAALSVANGATTISGIATDTAFAYQFLAGTRAYVNDRLYFFGEYKFFGATYNYKSAAATHPLTTLEFQTHLFAGGIGMAF